MHITVCMYILYRPCYRRTCGRALAPWCVSEVCVHSTQWSVFSYYTTRACARRSAFRLEKFTRSRDREPGHATCAMADAVAPLPFLSLSRRGYSTRDETHAQARALLGRTAEAAAGPHTRHAAAGPHTRHAVHPPHRRARPLPLLYLKLAVGASAASRLREATAAPRGTVMRIASVRG